VYSFFMHKNSDCVHKYKHAPLTADAAVSGAMNTLNEYTKKVDVIHPLSDLGFLARPAVPLPEPWGCGIIRLVHT